MIQSRKIPIIVAVAMAFALTISVSLVIIANVRAGTDGFKTEPEYAAKVFGTDIISIEIVADEDDWQNMLDNARNEQFIMVDVIVNGTKFQNVGIRPKGNSSLTQVASSDSDRYSFRLQFDEYIKDQTCFGLESFVLNNMIGDSTYMKEYVSYELMKEAGVDAPYFGFADIKVNGENWGLYLAVELYNDSYEQRVFGDTSGMLYNVKSMDMNGGDADQRPDMDSGMRPGNQPQRRWNRQQDQSQGQSQSQGQQGQPANGFLNRPVDRPGELPGTEMSGVPELPDGMNGFPAMPDSENFREMLNNMKDMNFPAIGGGFMGFGGRGGGSLEYIDDNVESYSSIFNNVVGKGSESDYKRVVEAIEALSEGRELETYFNVDKILRYLAAHTFVVNLDSYSSSMAQNYYIYERDGQITILPWDYNLAWGGFQSGSASSVINFPIDTPVSGVEMSSRPLIEKLLSNTEYLERYHSYLQQLIDNYFANGKFEEHINELDALISDYVKNDATAFCTYEQYKTAVSSFITLGNLRAQSVQGQLDGTVPSTTEGQAANPDKLVPAGDLKLSDLGTMMGGRNAMGQNGGGRAPDGNMGFPFPNFGGIGQGSADGGQAGNGTAPADNGGTPPAGFGGMRQPRQGMDSMGPGVVNANAGRNTTGSNLTIIGVSALVLLAALIFTARYRRTY